MRARRAVVRGIVQGVGFRFFAERAARGLGLRGWVRNCPDGSVETVAEGEDGAVMEYMSWLERGPATARVDEVAVDDVAPEGFTTFEVRR